MPTTPSSALRYPQGTDSPNIAQYFQNLATDLDQKVVVQAANQTARTSLANKYDGMRVYQQDTRRTYKWNAGTTSWDYLDGPAFTWTPTLLDASATTITATSINTQGSYVIRDGWIDFAVAMKFNGGVNGGAGNLQLQMPANVLARTSEPLQYHISALLYTATSAANWVGSGYAVMNSSRVGILFPVDATHSNVSEFRNATSVGASGTGIPLISASYPLADGSRLDVRGKYELSSWPAL